ncbi:MAG: hypothetical protein H0T54_06740 [Geodermatophilaceae bacterium]|nr:hypothetical protein [Geodermatophilaceae bacterium]
MGWKHREVQGSPGIEGVVDLRDDESFDAAVEQPLDVAPAGIGEPGEYCHSHALSDDTP